MIRPPMPNTPKPGITRTSNKMQNTPPTNSKISSHSAVPDKNFIQKNRMKQSNATKPGTLNPGALTSIESAMNRIKINKVDSQGRFPSHSTMCTMARSETVSGIPSKPPLSATSSNESAKPSASPSSTASAAEMPPLSSMASSRSQVCSSLASTASSAK